jgi:hypothetical protein
VVLEGVMGNATARMAVGNDWLATDKVYRSSVDRDKHFGAIIHGRGEQQKSCGRPKVDAAEQMKNERKKKSMQEGGKHRVETRVKTMKSVQRCGEKGILWKDRGIGSVH